MLGDIFSKALDWIYPPRCISCDILLPMGKLEGTEHMPSPCVRRWFCGDCYSLLEWIEGSVCQKCGRPIEGSDETCHECRSRCLCFERNYSVFIYKDVFRDIVHQFKYHGHPGYARGLGEIAVMRLGVSVFDGIDYVVPVPMYRKKERRRGYNQAELLARSISKHSSVPMLSGELIRIRDTKPQSRLSAQARENNMKDAFTLKNKIQITAKKIIIVDDIYTTGSTISACAEVLMHGGAGMVYGVTLSAAVKDGMENEFYS